MPPTPLPRYRGATRLLQRIDEGTLTRSYLLSFALAAVSVLAFSVLDFSAFAGAHFSQWPILLCFTQVCFSFAGASALAFSGVVPAAGAGLAATAVPAAMARAKPIRVSRRVSMA